MITVTPFWFVESGVYNINFEFNGFLFGALVFFFWLLLLCPFILLFIGALLDEYDC